MTNIAVFICTRQHRNIHSCCGIKHNNSEGGDDDSQYGIRNNSLTLSADVQNVHFYHC